MKVPIEYDIIYSKKNDIMVIGEMNKIKEKLIEAKAKRELGEELYNNIKSEFLASYKQLCASALDIEDGIDCQEIIEELKDMKNQIWVASLFQFLGCAVSGVSIWRMDMYGIEQTVISSIVGLVMLTVASLSKHSIKKEYNELQDDLIMYINAKKNGGIDIEEENKEYNYANIPCREACNEIVDL